MANELEYGRTWAQAYLDSANYEDADDKLNEAFQGPAPLRAADPARPGSSTTAASASPDDNGSPETAVGGSR